MALNFNPPEWLLQEYYKQKTPYEEASSAIQSGLAAYLALDESKRRNKTTQREMDLREQEAALKGREQFYNYGDIQGLPRNVQPAIGQAPQGPMTESGQMPAPDPLIDHYNKFIEQNPFGLKGQQMTEDTVLLKDEKGNIIGTSKVQRPIKGRTLMTGPSATMQGQNYNFTKPQQTPLTDQSGRPLEYTPAEGYRVARMPEGITAVPRKGDESAVSDANLIAAQLPQVDALFDAYKNKSGAMGRIQATPAGYLLDPALKQTEQSLKLAAFTFGGKNLTGQEKEVVFGALFPKWTDNDQARENKRELLKNFFSGKIDLLEAANLLGPAGTQLRQMLQNKAQGSSIQDAPVVEDGYIYTPGPGGKANKANWRKQ